jgi:hypothetical protein
MAISMRVAEDGCEGDDEELIAEIVADVQNPVMPIFETARLGERLHNLGRVITRLSEVVDHGAPTIHENLLRVGAVEIHLGHVQPHSNDGQQRDAGIRGLLDGAAREWER